MVSRKVAVIGACAIAAALVFSATVMAGPSMKSWLEVLVMNTPESPVPVEVQGALPVEVTVDASGWLHTTASGKHHISFGGIGEGLVARINTTGYRQITFFVESTTMGGSFYYFYYVDDENFAADSKLFPIYTDTVYGPTNRVVVTVDVVSPDMAIYAGTGNEAGASIDISYYMTT